MPPSHPIRALIVIPTYNERGNIDDIIRLVRAATPDSDILIVDDNSPDGTGKRAIEIAGHDAKVNVLHRAQKDGLSRAYVAGFTWGLERNFDSFVQMDADLSHDPADLPRFLTALKQSDAAFGCRYMPGGDTPGWSLLRRLISRFGCLYARRILGVPYRDLTGGFNAWSRATLEKIRVRDIESRGYVFQVEMKYRAALAGCRIEEVPIHFHPRQSGKSKMSPAIAWEAMLLVWKLKARK